MQCEQCGGLVTWRGPLSELTHTQCEGCGGINCQVIEVNANEDEPCTETFVGHSIMLGGWCVYAQTERAEYDVLRGPFGGQDEANAALDRLMNKTPNVKSQGREHSERPAGAEG